MSSPQTFRVRFFAPGVSGMSEPMLAEQAKSWAQAVVAAFPGLEFELILSDLPPATDPQLSSVPFLFEVLQAPIHAGNQDQD